jgi:hypothetical protein
MTKEGGSARSFLDDVSPPRTRRSLEQAGDLLELALGQLREERHALKSFEGGASHRDRSSLSDIAAGRRRRQW